MLVAGIAASHGHAVQHIADEQSDKADTPAPAPETFSSSNDAAPSKSAPEAWQPPISKANPEPSLHAPPHQPPPQAQEPYSQAQLTHLAHVEAKKLAQQAASAQQAATTRDHRQLAKLQQRVAELEAQLGATAAELQATKVGSNLGAWCQGRGLLQPDYC